MLNQNLDFSPNNKHQKPLYWYPKHIGLMPVRSCCYVPILMSMKFLDQKQTKFDKIMFIYHLSVRAQVGWGQWSKAVGCILILFLFAWFYFLLFSYALLIRTSCIIVQSEDDFYVRYYTLQLLTALITNSPKR